MKWYLLDLLEMTIKKNIDNYDFNMNIGDLKCIIYEAKKMNFLKGI